MARDGSQEAVLAGTRFHRGSVLVALRLSKELR